MDILLNTINIPHSWIAVNIKRRQLPRGEKTGHGLVMKWIHY
jgi:hypothetical protein